MMVKQVGGRKVSAKKKKDCPFCLRAQLIFCSTASLYVPVSYEIRALFLSKNKPLL
jgi:hypothetical protein